MKFQRSLKLMVYSSVLGKRSRTRLYWRKLLLGWLLIKLIILSETVTNNEMLKCNRFTLIKKTCLSVIRTLGTGTNIGIKLSQTRLPILIKAGNTLDHKVATRLSPKENSLLEFNLCKCTWMNLKTKSQLTFPKTWSISLIFSLKSFQIDRTNINRKVWRIYSDYTTIL